MNFASFHFLLASAAMLVAVASSLAPSGLNPFPGTRSMFDIQFVKCQSEYTYSDDLAMDEDATTVVSTDRFVIFRLCESTDCHRDKGCVDDYGEYMMGLEDYLRYSTEFNHKIQEQFCETCKGKCEPQNGQLIDNLSNECNDCIDECMRIESMEENGYIDASEFIECQMIYYAENDDETLYAGPMCASFGSKIKIGVFTDKLCNNLDNTKRVDDYLVDGDGYRLKLSYNLLKKTYSQGCIPCADSRDAYDNTEEEGNDAASSKVMGPCMTLYHNSAKCGHPSGLDGYESVLGKAQPAQEVRTCGYIHKVLRNDHDEGGEILLQGNISIENKSGVTTRGQKLALICFIILTVVLAIYAAILLGRSNTVLYHRGSTSG